LDLDLTGGFGDLTRWNGGWVKQIEFS